VPWEPLVDGGDVDDGFVADGELVVAGGDSPVALEPADAALDCVTLLVELWVKGRRAASGAAPVLAVADLVSRFGDSGADAATPQVGAVGAGAVGLIAQDAVRAVRGRPGPALRTAMPASTAANWGLSPRWPAVITIDSGRWPCSQARCTLVVSPPRDRPSA
jgi:hypothetical protein